MFIFLLLFPNSNNKLNAFITNLTHLRFKIDITLKNISASGFNKQ